MATTPAGVGNTTGAQGLSADDQGYLDRLKGQQDSMKAFTEALTALEMDGKKHSNAYKAIQSMIQSMPA
jgi:hypothetical protein